MFCCLKDTLSLNNNKTILTYELLSRSISVYSGGDLIMANLKAAIKRVDTNNTKRARNQKVKSDMRTSIKKVENLVEANDLNGAKAAYVTTVRVIDKAVQKGVVHTNNGNRQKARLAKKLSTATA